MYVVRTSFRALFLAMIPLAIAHAVMTAFALLALAAAKPVPSEGATPDQILTFFATRLIVDGALLFAGHWLLRQQKLSSRTAYAAMGAAMAAVGYAIAIRNSLDLASPASGTVLTIGVLPALAGALAGFLYGQFAGREYVAPAPAAADQEAAATPMTFDGPVRVRTSMAGVATAAIVPAVLSTMLAVAAVSLLPGYFNYLTQGHGPALEPVMAAAIPAHFFIAMLVGTIVPAAIFVLCLHGIARALQRRRGVDYAMIGSVLALICGHLLQAFAPFTSELGLLVLAAMFGAIMGVLYRRLAGLEPVPLPEAVIATSTEALVGADHPSRRQHRVIIGN